MSDKQEQLSNLLDEYATYLELDRQDGRAHAYDKAARVGVNTSVSASTPCDRKI